MLRSRLAVLPAVVLLAACGGGSGDDPAGTTAAAGATTPSSATAVASGSPTEGMGLSGGGVVSVGDQTWEFTLDGPLTSCVYFAGDSIGGVGFTVDASGERETFQNQTAVAVDFHLPVEGVLGVEPVIRVRDNVNDVEWRAGGVGLLPGVPAGSSQVDAWEVGDGTVSATATFLEWDAASSGGEIVVMTGTLEASCG